MQQKVYWSDWQTVPKKIPKYLRDYKYGNGKSKLAQNLLDNKHNIGPIVDILEILHIRKKGKMMNTLENFYIHKETKMNNQINDKVTFRQNILFDTSIGRNSGREQPEQ